MSLSRSSATSVSSSSAIPPASHIWAARNVEWPIPSVLSTANYQKLWRASRQTGAQLGIASADNGPNNTEIESTETVSTANPNTPRMTPNAAGVSGGGGVGGGGDGGESTSYFTGFMNRVLNTSGAAQGDNKSDSNKTAADSGGAGGGGSRPLRPPRPHCVATANGWIVAALECPSPTAGILRLVSRWNVRRGSSADQWMALPPASAHGNARVQHVFVDPTGCHTIVSAQNGEAYYLHSSLRLPQKLAGFGPNADGSLPATLTGISATSSSHAGMGGSGSAAAKDNTQQGLTTGSYVTAVAWDVERGTEGSTKKILLGTNVGEIYEYVLTSPNSESTDEAMEAPLLMHRLVRDGGDEGPAAVTGLHLERLRTGLLIIASTSGRNCPRTRLYTFYSAHNTSFRMALADQQHATLVDIPGAVDFAELRLCSDNFGLRTAMGVYYGTIDRSQSSNVLVTGGRSMIVDAGILPYEDVVQESTTSSNVSSAISSLALTPHHMILLNDSNDHHQHRPPEVRFINRVAQKVIQKERMDLLTHHSNSGSAQQSNNPFATSSNALEDSALWLGAGELLMDIRRPDQVWLRQGRSLIHFSSTDEGRDVWKFTLSKCLEKPKGQRGAAPSSTSLVMSPSLSRSISGAGPVLTDEEKAQEALFEQAKNLCTNAAQKAVVTNIRAEYHLSQGRAELSAKYLAQCPAALAPFADTAIRLALPRLGIDDPQGYGHSASAKNSLSASNIPLISYLSDKLRVAQMNQDRMTATMLGAWLTELYLHERGEQPHRGSMASGGRHDDAMLGQFLSNLQNTDAKTIMRILASHDVSATECASYAAQSGDIATAVNTALAAGSDNASAGAQDGLRILNSGPFELAEPLYYRHASNLLARAPALAGKSFLTRYANGLSPTRLLPSIMHYEKLRNERAKKMEESRKIAEELTGMGGGGVTESKEGDYADQLASEKSKKGSVKFGAHNTSTAGFVDDPEVSIKYLEGVIQQGCRSSAIFSFLISLYVKLADEDPLYRFLAVHVPAATTFADAALNALLSCDRSKPQQMMTMMADEEFSTPLDMSYALRAVLSSGRHFRSAIKLYMGFGMRQQAVELALKVDPSLARELAQDSTGLEERKRLWLMIAKHAASSGSHGGKDVVSKVVSVLRDCGPDVLSIEDVLPFLPDFAQIDQIKDEICEALTAYSSKIEAFLKEMNDCDQTCGNLREEIKRLRTHRMKVQSDARCALSNQPVLNAGEPFYVFPSGYVFLSSALRKEVMPFLNEKQEARVHDLERQLQSIHSMSITNAEDESRARSLQTELDGLIAAECPLTGSVLVNSIDKGFEDSEEIDLFS